MKIDHIDLRLIEILCENARVSSRELSEMVGLSPNAVTARLKHLHTNKLIAGYFAKISYELLAPFECWMDVIPTDERAETLTALESLIEASPDVAQAHIMHGANILIRVLVISASFEENQAFQRTLEGHRTFVKAVYSVPIFKTLRTSPKLPRHVLSRLLLRAAESEA